MNLTLHETTSIQDSSKIMEYMSCPRKYFFRYILGWEKEEPNIHLIHGSAWHEAKEVILRMGYGPGTADAAFEAYLNYYRQYYPEYMDMTNAPKDPATTRKAIIEYLATYSGVDTFTNLYTEIGVSVPIDDKGTSVFAKLDSININQRSKYFSLEHKTGSQETSWWHDQWEQRFQIGTYYHVLCAQYGFEDTFGIVVDGTIFRKKGNTHLRHHVMKTLDQMEDWLTQANYWVASIEADKKYLLEEASENTVTMGCFQKNTNSCISYNKLCPFFHSCHAWVNPLKNMDMIPAGYHVSFWDPRKGDDKGKQFKIFLDLYNKEYKEVDNV